MKTTATVYRSMTCGYENDLHLNRYMIVDSRKPLVAGTILEDLTQSAFVEMNGTTVDAAILEAKRLAIGSKTGKWTVYGVRLGRMGLIEACEPSAWVTRQGKAMTACTDSELAQLATA